VFHTLAAALGLSTVLATVRLGLHFREIDWGRLSRFPGLTRVVQARVTVTASVAVRVTQYSGGVPPRRDHQRVEPNIE
jgi:hypothetical protein